MAMDWNRKLSGLLVLAYIVGAYLDINAEAAFKVMIGCIFPLACIWFAEAMGGYVGPTTMINITNQSPGMVVCILGWVILLLPVFVMIIQAV
jgi:hypothetical protein